MNVDVFLRTHENSFFDAPQMYKMCHIISKYKIQFWCDILISFSDQRFNLTSKQHTHHITCLGHNLMSEYDTFHTILIPIKIHWKCVLHTFYTILF